jgi:beta-phosphoglucomutase-like phosphatase (HAD superfamily)
VRACIFDVDGLLIDSEDIYTEAYNNVLREYGKPDLPWAVKARQQSRGRQVRKVSYSDPMPDYRCAAVRDRLIRKNLGYHNSSRMVTTAHLTRRTLRQDLRTK